jgi:Sulfotransferase family
MERSHTILASLELEADVLCADNEHGAPLLKTAMTVGNSVNRAAELPKAKSIKQRLDAARKEAGCTDYGELDFVEPLTELVKVAHAYDLTEQGRRTLEEQISRLLVNRLRFQRDMTRYPEILREDVADPLVIMGLPRTGTSMMNRLLAADPRAESLSTWRCFNPAPFPDAEAGVRDPRIAPVELIEATLRKHNPESIAMHEFMAEGAEEEGYLHLFSFRAPLQVVMWPGVPGYLEYLRRLPQEPSYRYVKKLLQYLQWQDGGKRGRHWILKNPGHLGYIKELLTQHPKATLFLAHRNVAEVIPSICRVIELTLLGRNRVSRTDIGQTMLDYWGGEMRRFQETRKRLGPKLKLLEYSYKRVVSDPIGVTEEIYAAADIAMTKEARQCLEQWHAQNQQYKHGKYVYTLEQYGLTEEKVFDAFGAYTGVV